MPEKVSEGVPILLVVAVLYLLVRWIKDLLFYYKNGWDFSQPSGYKMDFDEGPNGKEMGNKGRIFFGYPFMLAVCLVLLLSYWAN